MKTFFRHLSSMIAPVMMSLVFPYLIIRSEHNQANRSWLAPSPVLRVAGLVVTAAGFALLVATIRMFIRIGRGTIMPWDPSRRLITGSLYGHVRNPMILSILVLLSGEALLFRSSGIVLLAVLFFTVNTVYFIFSEEPGLEKRFGAEYAEYRRSVPRWVPRLKSWQPRQPGSPDEPP